MTDESHPDVPQSLTEAAYQALPWVAHNMDRERAMRRAHGYVPLLWIWDHKVLDNLVADSFPFQSDTWCEGSSDYRLPIQPWRENLEHLVREVGPGCLPLSFRWNMTSIVFKWKAPQYCLIDSFLTHGNKLFLVNGTNYL